MRNLFNPKWIYIINTLPLAVLIIIFYQEFIIIKSLLNKESISLWLTFGWTLGILVLCNFCYALYLTTRKKAVSVVYGGLALTIYIPYIYLFGVYSELIIPSSIPQWIVPRFLIIYVGTFLMPTLAYALFIIVQYFTPESKEHKTWNNILYAIVVPCIWYIFSQLIIPLWKPVEGNFSIHAIIIFIIIGTILFLFFLTRAIYIISTKKIAVWKKYQLAWKIPISIVLPIIGLLVNNGYLLDTLGHQNSGIFGNFNSRWYFLLALINGLFICLPNIENRIYRILLFTGRCITFTYTLYFFLVFLPFLPISLIAIVAIGTGFLMLTPLLLFIIHINEIAQDFIYLKDQYSRNKTWPLSIAGFMVIPLTITSSYLIDRSTLNKTLEYLYTPDYSKTYNIDKTSLQNTLATIKTHKENQLGGISETQTPYLSSFFNWIVLDNMTLSDSKIQMIEKVFFGKASFDLQTDNIQNNNVDITDVKSSSTFDNTQNAWISTIDLEITNKNKSSLIAEFASTFELPDGSWISDFYINIGNNKTQGILAEKKSAMWVFSNIRNENRDPGILYYLSGNKVSFRIFPFAPSEVRKAEFELIHKEPIILTLDGNTIELGKSDDINNYGFENENIIYVSSKQKQSLKKVIRNPYYHFIVDISQKEKIPTLTRRLGAFISENKSLTDNARISFANSYCWSYKLDKRWKEILQTQKFEGGFYIDRAIKTVLFNAYKEHSDSYPVLLVVTDSIQNGVFEKDFSDWKFTFPESNTFYDLIDNGKLIAHSLIQTPDKAISDSTIQKSSNSALEYKVNDTTIAYIPDNNKPSIILKSETFKTDLAEIKPKNWQSALTIQGIWMSQILHPEYSNKEWINLVKYSFESRIMSPATSYLVVENEAQKAILKKKQEQVLSTNKSFDIGEDTQRMSEPNLIILAIFIGFAIWFRTRNKKRWVH